MADFNAMYAVVDKSKKKQKSFIPLPEDGTAESSADTSPPLYDVARGDVSTKPAPEKAEVIDSEYSMITAEPVNPRAKKPAPENSQEYNTLQCPMQEAPANRTEVFDSTYSMITLDNVHSTVNDGDLQSQQPAETAPVASKDTSKAHRTISCKTTFFCIFIAIAAVVIIALIACIAFLFIKVGELEAETASLQPGELEALNSRIVLQLQQIDQSILTISGLNSLFSMSIGDLSSAVQKQGEALNELQEVLNTSVQMLSNQLSEASSNYTQELNSSIEEFNAQFNQDITAVEAKTRQLIDYLQIGVSEDDPSPSCAALRGLSPSGYYWVRTSNGSAVRVYCDMTRSCGGVTGGWVRVAYLDKTNSSQNGMCPSGLSEYMFSSRQTCRRDNTSAGCSSVGFTSRELSYSKVCGRIAAFTEGAPEGFMRTDDTDINVDGVSLTHGAPRQHIWTFAVTSNDTNHCSCNNSNTARTHPPEYVGNDYFCDTRFRESGVDKDLVLWQGTDCTSSNACCSFNNPPWFYKQLPQPTTDGIEMRVCRDDRGTINEDIYIQIAEVYIQ